MGTLLALLVFFALFGVFLTQYLPLWMTDDESQFSSQVESSFAQFKSDVDSQYVLNGPSSYGVPFPLSSQSVPLLAQPTQGILALSPPACLSNFNANGTPVAPTQCVFERVYLNISSATHSSQNHPYLLNDASSVVQMQIPNRYYTPQTYYLEDDALVQIQPGGHEILAIPPPLNATYVAGNLSVSTSFLETFGTSATVVGQGSENVYSGLLFSQTVTSAGRFLSASSPATALPFTLTYQIGTRNVCAWDAYLSNFTAASGIPAADAKLTVNYGAAFNVTSTVCLDASDATYLLTYTLSNVNYATLYYAGVQVSMGVGGG